MPKIVKELSALEVKRLEYPSDKKGDKALPVLKLVGGIAGLHLQLTPGGGRSWVLRYSVENGTDAKGEKKYKRRSLGLGSYPEVGIGEARDRARAAKGKIREGQDPIKERRAARQKLAVEVARWTFAKAIDGWDKAHPNKFSSDKHRQVWLASLRNIEGLQKIQVDQIAQEDLWRFLEPIAERTPDTANRVRGRIEEVLAWAEDEKQRSGLNPAATDWLKRKLSAKKPPAGTKVSLRPALQVEDAPRWMAALRKLDGMGSRALEFMALTAARSGEARGATWDEIDLSKGVWTVPAARMKMKQDHAVPLTADVIEMLEALPRLGDLVFPAARGGEMSDMTPTATMRRLHEADLEAGGQGYLDKDRGRPAVPHGLRTTFRNWAGERMYPRELAELSLAHQFGSKVEQAYFRSNLLEQRRPMMEAWAAHLAGRNADGNVVELRRG